MIKDSKCSRASAEHDEAGIIAFGRSGAGRSSLLCFRPCYSWSGLPFFSTVATINEQICLRTAYVILRCRWSGNATTLNTIL